MTEEKDLGVFVTNDLKPSRHCQEARKKSLKMLGMLNRNVEYKSKIVMKKLYCAYVRPHLESPPPPPPPPPPVAAAGPPVAAAALGGGP